MITWSDDSTKHSADQDTCAAQRGWREESCGMAPLASRDLLLLTMQRAPLLSVLAMQHISTPFRSVVV